MHTFNPSRGRWISELRPIWSYKVSFRTAGQENPVSGQENPILKKKSSERWRAHVSAFDIEFI